jgi:hypothetical protein
MTRRVELWSKVKVQPGCWEWQGRRDRDGYGKKGNDLVHRLSYEEFYGSIPEGLTIDHLCRNRACVNPAHMEPVTREENVLRGESFGAQNARKTHCVHGHPFNEENTYIRSNGQRDCRACGRDRTRRYAQRKAGVAA